MPAVLWTIEPLTFTSPCLTLAKGEIVVLTVVTVWVAAKVNGAAVDESGSWPVRSVVAVIRQTSPAPHDAVAFGHGPVVTVTSTSLNVPLASVICWTLLGPLQLVSVG